MTKIAEGGYLQLRDAAETLGVSPNTLRNWDRSGKLLARRHPLNKYRLYKLSDIKKLLGETGGTYAGAATDLAIEQPPFQIDREAKEPDDRTLRRVFRQLGRAFRDSQGGGLIERFEEISKLLFCKVHDESLVRQGEATVFAIARQETSAETHAKIALFFSRVARKFPKVFTGDRASLTADKQAVRRAVEILQGVTISGAGDVKGSAYEELIRDTFEKTENQQFFTPRKLVKFMVEVLQPTENEVICDPACGSGGFLVEALKHIRSTQARSGRLIVGGEIDPRMAWVAQMNVLMHGGDPGSIVCDPKGGTLARDGQIQVVFRPKSCDLIITNPPFGSDFSDRHQLAAYETGRGRTSRRRGILFIERCLEFLRPGGRLGIVIDDSVLNGAGNEDIRRIILRDSVVDAVISLPEVAFKPYAAPKASILFLTKRTSGYKERPVFMANVENVGRRPNGDPLYAQEKGADGRLTLLDDLPAVLRAWKQSRRNGGQLTEDFESKAFLISRPEFHDNYERGGELRLDVMSHHPTRQLAEKALMKCRYPTPRLRDLVIERNTSCVPSLSCPDETCRYMSLSQIEAKTGEYSVVETRGERIMSAVHIFHGGDIVFSRLRPELRKIALIADNEDEGFISGECMVLRALDRIGSGGSQPSDVLLSSNHEVDSEYLAFMLRSDLIFGQLVFQVTGVGRPRVTKQVIRNLRVPLPPMAVQRKMVAIYRKSRDRYLSGVSRSRQALAESEQAVTEGYSHIQEELFAD